MRFLSGRVGKRTDEPINLVVPRQVIRTDEVAMFRKPSGGIAECYLRASQARERARSACDPRVEQDFLKIERRWLSLAHSYEVADPIPDVSLEPGRKRA